MSICIHCGRENPDGEILCLYCGLVILDPNGQEAPDSGTRLLDLSPRAQAFPAWGTASLGTERKLLLHVRGYDKPLVVSLAERVVLGRYNTDTGEKPDIDLQDYQALESGVSRRHAVILFDEDGVKVMDLGSQNFTFINGQKLMPDQPRILRDGDELRLGRLVIRVGFA